MWKTKEVRNVLLSRGFEHWLQQARVLKDVNKVFNSVYLTLCSFCTKNTSPYTNPIEACCYRKKKQKRSKKSSYALRRGNG